MQQHPLVAGAEPERVAHVLRVEPGDVAHRDHGALHVGQLVDRLLRGGEGLGRHEAALGQVVEAPRWRRPVPCPPLALRDEPIGIDGHLVGAHLALRERGERQRASLARGAGLRRVREDAEKPRLQRRTALEAPDAAQDPEPRLLDDLLGDGAALDTREGQAEHHVAPAIDEIAENPLVAFP